MIIVVAKIRFNTEAERDRAVARAEPVQRATREDSPELFRQFVDRINDQRGLVQPAAVTSAGPFTAVARNAALRVEFSIRHQPFLWATDLSMPDRLFALPEWFASIKFMPDYFNLLPLVMLVLWVIQDEVHIATLATHAVYRRQGIAKRLLLTALASAHSEGARSAFLEVRESNEQALGLYRSLGFNEVSRRRGYYPARNGREDAIESNDARTGTRTAESGAGKTGGVEARRPLRQHECAVQQHDRRRLGMAHRRAVAAQLQGR